MKAIIISAGQGSRLLPLTLDMPKCLVHVNGRAILDHQIVALRAAGIAEIVVVGGYRYEQLAAHVAAASPRGRVSIVRNPFWAAGSSIGSVWAARAHLDGPFCLLNGDTIFDEGVFDDALAAMRPGVNLVVERLGDAEPDDMLVAVEGGRVAAVAKTLDRAAATHRSLGIVLSPDTAGGGYAAMLEAVIGAPGGTDAYHHAIVDRLARSGQVIALENSGPHWQEIDTPQDIDRWTRDHVESPRATD
ncbi:MAG: phosphocholine cytidylyltransferase family protein [Sphingomonadaceae bacterium]|nr:phosphocholine cytidylyltransferase family protein [Sphingomonadaceae bacterium]